MRKETKIVLLLLLTIACDSCKKSMEPRDYVNYVNNKENGLKKIVPVDGFEFSMQYKPYDYIILLENKGEKANGNIDERKQTLKGTAWFNISIKRQDNSVSPLRFGISSLEEYNTRLNYYLNEAKKDIWLLYGTDTIRPVSYLFENNYNLAPQETIVVGFYLPKGQDHPQEDMQLAFNDQVFKNGIIKAKYTRKAINDIPNLKY